MSSRGRSSRHWAAPYVVCLLLACLITIAPTAMVADLNTPLTVWENWYWRGHPAPRPTFQFPDRIPSPLRIELAAFKALVIPPGILSKWLTGYAGHYANPFLMTPGSSDHSDLSVPPLMAALRHARFALPFWLLLSVLVYEAVRMLGRRFRHRDAVA